MFQKILLEILILTEKVQNNGTYPSQSMKAMLTCPVSCLNHTNRSVLVVLVLHFGAMLFTIISFGVVGFEWSSLKNENKTDIYFCVLELLGFKDVKFFIG